jgi:hypothetical protein
MARPGGVHAYVQALRQRDAGVDRTRCPPGSSFGFADGYWLRDGGADEPFANRSPEIEDDGRQELGHDDVVRKSIAHASRWAANRCHQSVTSDEIRHAATRVVTTRG